MPVLRCRKWQPSPCLHSPFLFQKKHVFATLPGAMADMVFSFFLSFNSRDIEGKEKKIQKN